MPEVVRAGARIAYEVSGDGPALVLIRNNRRPRDFRPADWLADRFRVVQVHPVGFGASERPAEYDFGSIGAQVLAVLDHEGIDRFVVWGFSQPACMAAMVARTTSRAAGLVMGGVAPIGIPTDGDMRRMEREPRLRRPPLEFWRAYRSHDWHHELRCFTGTKIVYVGTADKAINRVRRLKPVLRGIDCVCLEFEGLDHAASSLGVDTPDGRLIVEAVVEHLPDGW
ncbi:alpha/beta fold hydrolase [Kribbella pittospori]|uniref:Alpha/beta fold hydrolase n=1 Tax=Kribbella pittospori TaxID=722689 RepID=A0A4R0KLD1_9ACTN|nr:alpha/beta fold hydrolase [Kribbella pittospori]TCC58868.1 alpha/beta fold hydrolase [Kribbella pittospori]